MKSIELSTEKLRELQLKSLEIMIHFKKFCEDNNLLCYLCGGCCIGAIRHGGFIPWDDDVDVMMPREDYEKLSKLWRDTEKYVLLRTRKEKFCGHIFTTIVDKTTTLIREENKNSDVSKGVAIDVFPLDGCPKTKFARKLQMFWAMIYSLYLAQIAPVNHGKLISLVGKLLLGVVPSKNLRHKIWKFSEKQMSKHKIKDCAHITELCAGPGYMKNEYPKEIFSSAVLKNFEGHELPLPVGYDTYLKIAFKNYMGMPPKEKQKPHHNILYVDLDKPFN